MEGDGGGTAGLLPGGGDGGGWAGDPCMCQGVCEERFSSLLNNTMYADGVFVAQDHISNVLHNNSMRVNGVYYSVIDVHTYNILH